MKATRYPTVQYDPAMDYDGGQGGLRIYIPDEKGYINYNLVHTVVEEKNADTWRMTIAFEADTAGNLLRQLTKGRAEWEMAVRLADRPDFIGGYNHGDERYTALKLAFGRKRNDAGSAHLHDRIPATVRHSPFRWIRSKSAV